LRLGRIQNRRTTSSASGSKFTRGYGRLKTSSSGSELTRGSGRLKISSEFTRGSGRSSQGKRLQLVSGVEHEYEYLV
jgi:hypothetical protein